MFAEPEWPEGQVDYKLVGDVEDCVFATSCALPSGVVAHPATAVPAEALEAYGDWAVMAKSNVTVAEPAQWRMLAGTLNQSFKFGYQLDLALLNVLPGLTVGGIAMLIPRTIAADSAFYKREQYDLLHSVNTQVRLGFKELPDGSINAYGVYTGGNPSWRKMQPVMGVAEGENFVFDLGDGIKLTWTPIVDATHVLGIPALEGVDNPGLTLVHPGEEVGPGQTYENPIHSPDVRDAILVFPLAGIAPLYVALSVRPGDHKYHSAPKSLAAFPDAKWVTSKTQVSGGGSRRQRWKDSQGKIYEWDRQHGTVELYNARGKHLGEFNPETGEQTKPAHPSRRVEK